MNDPDHRLAVMRAEGIVGECVFPTIGLYVWMLTDPVGGAASCRVYNEWIADGLARSPRFRCAGLVPTGGWTDVLAEVAWIADHGLAAVMLPATVAPEWNHPQWAPLWRAVEETGLPVVIHQGTGHSMYFYRGAGAGVANLLATQSMGPRAAGLLATSGVLAGAPGPARGLRGVQRRLDRVDHADARLLHDRVRAVRHHAVGQAVGEPAAARAAERVPRAARSTRPSRTTRWGCTTSALTGPDVLIWGSDYPHEEGTHPHSWRWSARLAAGLDRAPPAGCSATPRPAASASTPGPRRAPVSARLREPQRGPPTEDDDADRGDTVTDTPEQAEFRADGAGVPRGQRQAPRRRRARGRSRCTRSHEAARAGVREGAGLAAHAVRRTGSPASPTRWSWAAGAAARGTSASTTRRRRSYDTSSGFVSATIAMLGPDADEARDRRAEGALRAAAARRPSTRSASCSASRARAATSPGSRARRCATATSSWSPARRCGTRRRSSATGACCSCAPTPTCPSTGASRSSSSTCTRPGIEVRPLVQPTGASEFNEVFLERGARPGRQRDRRDRRRLGPGPHRALERVGVHRWRQHRGRRSLRTPARDLADLHGRRDDPTIRQGLADYYMRERIVGVMGERIMAAVRQRQVPPVDPSALKLFTTESRVRSGNLAMAIARSGRPRRRRRGRDAGSRWSCSAASRSRSAAAPTRCRRTTSPSARSVCRGAAHRPRDAVEGRAPQLTGLRGTGLRAWRARGPAQAPAVTFGGCGVARPPRRPAVRRRSSRSAASRRASSPRPCRASRSRTGSTSSRARRPRAWVGGHRGAATRRSWRRNVSCPADRRTCGRRCVKIVSPTSGRVVHLDGRDRRGAGGAGARPPR